MITYCDYVADEYRRQDAMERAEHYRLVQTIISDCAQGPRYWRRCIGRVGALFVALGKRMQTPTIGQEPTAATR